MSSASFPSEAAPVSGVTSSRTGISIKTSLVSSVTFSQGFIEATLVSNVTCSHGWISNSLIVCSAGTNSKTSSPGGYGTQDARIMDRGGVRGMSAVGVWGLVGNTFADTGLKGGDGGTN